MVPIKGPVHPFWYPAILIVLLMQFSWLILGLKREENIQYIMAIIQNI